MAAQKGHLVARRVVPMLAVLVLAALLASCSGSKTEAADNSQIPPRSVVLTGAGSTFDSLLFKRWFNVYHTNHPNTFIKCDPVGSGEGVRRFIAKNVEFGASDAAMSDAEIAQANNDAVMVPVTSACVVLAYNLPGFHGDLRLSRDAYAGIFLGEVKNWNDPLIAKANPGLKLPNLTIVTVTRQDSSGTTFALTNNLTAINGRWQSRFGPVNLVNWPGNAMRANGNEGIAALIQKSEGSIGYVGYEFASRLGLDMAALENKEGKFIQPSEESCMTALATIDLPENLRAFAPDPSGADSYPIVTFSWILLRKGYNPQTADAVRDLFRWSLQDGQRYASQIGYVPLPTPVAEKALAAVNSISPGG